MPSASPPADSRDAAAIELRASVRRELRAERLVVEGASYARLESEIRSVGRGLRDGLRDRLGTAGYAELVRTIATDHPEDDIIRVLGHGHILARIAVAPVRLDVAASRQAVDLGAMANLIISVYDHALDTAGGAPAVFERRALVEVLDGADPPPLAQRPGDPGASVLLHLVRAFRDGTDALGASHACATIRRRVNEVVIRMYDVESATSHDPAASPAALRAKNALPFVVLGLPAWLAAPAIRSSAVEEHVRWLYRLGALFGAVDDVADVERDRASGHPNGVAVLLARGVPPGEVARRIALKARTVVGSNVLPATERETLLPYVATTITSWLGGAGGG